MVQAEKAFFYKSILQLGIPIIFGLPVFLSISPWTTWFPQLTSPQNLYFGSVFLMVGLAYMVEALIASVDILLAHKLRKNHGAGTLIFSGMALFSFVISFFMYTGLFNISDPFSDYTATVLLGISLAIFAYALLSGARKKSPIMNLLHSS